MSNNETAAGQQSSRKLKLVLTTSPLSTPIDSYPSVQPVSKDASSSPPRPSYSPVTPTTTHEHRLTTQEQTEPQWMDEPPPLPLNLDENTDAIALRATISLLQMQRQQSLRDIRQLDKIRDAALEDPRAFADELQAGKLKKPFPNDIVLDDIEYDDDDHDHDEDDDHSESIGNTSKFGPLPNPQNITRCPPIEWSKYHITGKPLEDMHNTQRRNPGLPQDSLRSTTTVNHNITAPYRPFTEKLSKQGRVG